MIQSIANIAHFKYIFIVYRNRHDTSHNQWIHRNAFWLECMQPQVSKDRKVPEERKGPWVQMEQMEHPAYKDLPAHKVCSAHPVKQYVITIIPYPPQPFMLICHLQWLEQPQSMATGTRIAIQILIRATLHGTIRPSWNPTSYTCRGLTKMVSTSANF